MIDIYDENRYESYLKALIPAPKGVNELKECGCYKKKYKKDVERPFMFHTEYYIDNYLREKHMKKCKSDRRNSQYIEK